MATRRRNDNNPEPDQRPIRPISTQPRVVRPHRQVTQPWLNEPEVPIDQMPTNRLPPSPRSQPEPVHREPPPPAVLHGDRNEFHTVYCLSQRAWTTVSGWYEVEADISRTGEIVLYAVAVGKQWKSVPFYLTHEAVKALVRADADAQRFYGFPDDDDEGA